MIAAWIFSQIAELSARQIVYLPSTNCLSNVYTLYRLSVVYTMSIFLLLRSLLDLKSDHRGSPDF